MSFTKCCNLRYIGENHNPVGDDGFCINCGHHPEKNVFDEISKMVPGVERGMKDATANILIMRELNRLKEIEFQYESVCK